ncbi:euronal acetylcholine receptor subunit alpha-7-like, partial [Tropilaelaps mercedesae]
MAKIVPFTLATAIAYVWASPAEEKLIHVMLTNYESNSRPVTHTADSLIVNLSYTPVKLEALDVDENEMVLHGWMQMSWKDHQLRWNVSDHDGITHLNLPIESLWKPDIKLYNAPESSVENTLALVHNDGTVMWVPPVTGQIACDFTVTWFPFDVQQCTLVFGSWTYDKTKIDLQVGPSI